MEGRHAGGRGYRWVARPGGLLLPISPTTIRASPAAYATHALRYWKIFVSRAHLTGRQEPLIAVVRTFCRFGVAEALNLLLKAEQLLHHTAYAESIETQRYLAAQFLFPSTLDQINRWIQDNARGTDVWIFSEQQLLTAICLTITHGRMGDPKSLRVAPFESLGLALLSISDHLEPLKQEIPQFETLSLPQQKRRMVESILRNGLFNQQDDYRHHIVRHHEMFCEIAPRMETHPQFVDLHRMHRRITGLSPPTFIAMGVALLCAFHRVTRDNAHEAPVSIPIRSFFRRTCLARAGRKFFKEISTTRRRFRRAYVCDLEVSRVTAYNFLEVQRHPLLRIRRDRAFCLSLRFIIERLGIGMHYRFLTGLPESDRSKYLTFCGYLFEEYVRRICMRMYPGGRFVSQVRYGANLEAADGWIIYPRTAIVLEAKASRFTLETFLSGSFGSFEDKFRESFLKGARQLDRTIRDFKAGLFAVDGLTATDLPVLYPILVTLQYVPQDVFLSEYIREAIRDENLFADTSIRPLQIIHIEDLEHLEGIVNAGTRLLDLLQRREGNRVWRDWPFSNFLVEQFPEGFPQNHHVVAKYQELLTRSAFQLFRERLRA